DQPAPNGHSANIWLPPIVRTVAIEGQGVDEVVAAIDAHRAYLDKAETLADVERQYIEIELRERLQAALVTRLLENVPSEAIALIIARVQSREMDPQTAVEKILALHDQALIKVQS